MSFSTVTFLVLFLPIAFILFYVSPLRIRKTVLIFLSLIFYAWGDLFHIWLLLLSSVVNYSLGLLIARRDLNKSKSILVFGILFNLLPLIIYKYFDFFLELLAKSSLISLHQFNFMLPLGLSFFAFQGISYIVDVYRDSDNVELNATNFFVYMCFFPKLISGPITPYNHMRNSINSLKLSISTMSEGLIRFSSGLAKKVIIADILGQLNSDIWAGLNSGISPSTAWLGVITYSLQLYIDFSSYTDMAIGLGKVFGIPLLENFDYPYISKSVTEFWKRWHISLSSWFKNYLYIPLGGNRRGNIYFNLLVVFIATGIWHGASVTFIVWGLWHGLFMLIERAVRDKSWFVNISPVIKWSATMVVVGFGWLLFKSANFDEFILYFKAMFGKAEYSWIQMGTRYFLDNRNLFTIVMAILISLPIMPFFRKRLFLLLGKKELLWVSIRQLFALVLLVLSFLYIVNSTYSPFIYFQF